MTQQTRYAVCLLASEVAPLSKTGGLADVAGALGKRAAPTPATTCACSRRRTRAIDRVACAARPVPDLDRLRLTVGAAGLRVLGAARHAARRRARCTCIDCPALFARATPLHQPIRTSTVRFLAFTRAALLSCREMRWAPRIVHCNDWHTALRAAVPAHQLPRRTAASPATRTLLTIHNIGYQGIFARRARRRTSGCRPRTCAPAVPAGPAPPGTSTRCATGSSMRTRSTRSARRTRARSARTSTAWACRTACARAARSLSGILNGVDYDGVGSAPRPLPAASTTIREHLAVKAQLKAQLLARARARSPPRRCRWPASSAGWRRRRASS